MITTLSAAKITHLSRAQESRALAVLTLAFAGDPGVRWMFADPGQYLAYFPRFALAFGGRAFERDGAHQTACGRGVALWLPPGISPDDQALGALLEEALSPEIKGEAFGVFEQMAAYHPAEPHWHLPLMGVDPTAQGRGLGSMLLEHVLERCDRDRVPAYLEATSPRSAAMYERHGFEPLGVIRSATCPEIVPMLRRAE